MYDRSNTGTEREEICWAEEPVANLMERFEASRAYAVQLCIKLLMSREDNAKHLTLHRISLWCRLLHSEDFRWRWSQFFHEMDQELARRGTCCRRRSCLRLHGSANAVVTAQAVSKCLFNAWTCSTTILFHERRASPSKDVPPHQFIAFVMR